MNCISQEKSLLNQIFCKGFLLLITSAQGVNFCYTWKYALFLPASRESCDRLRGLIE